MERAWVEKFTDDLQHTLGILLIVLVAYSIYKWSVVGYRYLTGMLKERNMSRRRIQTRKKKEAQVISDGATILLKELQKQGLLTDKGLLFWERKLKTIGLVKPEEDNLLGKAWHYPVTHSMRELKKYISKVPKKEVTTGRTVVCND